MAGADRDEPTNGVIETRREVFTDKKEADSIENVSNLDQEIQDKNEDDLSSESRANSGGIRLTDGKGNLRSIPQGRRWWKQSHKERFSMVRYKSTKPLSSSWDKKLKLRKERETIKELEDQLRTKKAEALQMERDKRAEKRKRKAENEMKNVSTQVIRKTEKLKSMSKKQLRMVRKTQVDKEGNVKLVPMYS